MRKFVEPDVADNPLYHDTWKLLKKYRDVVWSLELSVQHVRTKFEIEYAALESGAENVPTFQNVEIGGGRITGTEVTAEHPEGISFGMYHADQYVAPEGQYTTVHAVDGTAWYKQYAVDAVDKSPYMAPDGSIAFNESIVKKLPPAPRRKDKI